MSTTGIAVSKPAESASLRLLLRGVAGVFALATGAATIASYMIYRQKTGMPAGGNLYAGIEQWTALTYHFVWFVVSLLALAATFQRRWQARANSPAPSPRIFAGCVSNAYLPPCLKYWTARSCFSAAWR